MQRLSPWVGYREKSVVSAKLIEHGQWFECVRQEKKKLEAEVFGRMQPLALTEYRRIFRCSGLDIDNRQQALTKRYQSYTRRLETYISFANKISTFRKLPPADQASLFKGDG